MLRCPCGLTSRHDAISPRLLSRTLSLVRASVNEHAMALLSWLICNTGKLGRPPENGEGSLQQVDTEVTVLAAEKGDRSIFAGTTPSKWIRKPVVGK